MSYYTDLVDFIEFLREDQRAAAVRCHAELQKGAADRGVIAYCDNISVYIEDVIFRLQNPPAPEEEQFDEGDEPPRPITDYMPEQPGLEARTYWHPRPAIEGSVGQVEGIDTGFMITDRDVDGFMVTDRDVDEGLQKMYDDVVRTTTPDGVSKSQAKRIATQKAKRDKPGEETPPGTRSEAGPTIIIDRIEGSVKELVPEGQDSGE